MSKIIAVLLAGGSGARFGSSLPKQYHSLANGKTVLREVVDKFVSCSFFYKSFIVIRREDLDRCMESLLGVEHLVTVLFADDTRQKSVLMALESLKVENPEFVLVHDIVRPFFSKQLMSRVIAELLEGAADVVVPVVESTESLVRLSGESCCYLPRSDVYRAQTPQGLCFIRALDNHRICDQRDKCFSDEGSLMDYCGGSVVLIEGEPSNTKITFSCDLDVFWVGSGGFSSSC